jgi:hypothetical protein
MRRRKWLVANLTTDQSIYNFWARTHSHRLVERLAVRAFKLIVEHSTSSLVVYPCRQEARLLTVLASNIAHGKGRIVVDAAFST